MKNPEDIHEEQSKRIFWVVQTVFSLLLASSLFEYKACILNPLSSQYYLTTLGLVLVYGITLWSWIDYSFSTIVSPYAFGRGKFEKTRFAVDLSIVITYAHLLFSLDALQTDKGANLASLFYCLALVFALYLLSGLLRILQYGHRASRVWIIVTFSAVFLLLAIVYSSLYSNSPNKETQNIIFILLAIATTVGYRVTRTKIAHRGRWIAVDVDGVLANQITNLLPIIKRKHDVELKYENVKEWDLRVGNTNIAKIIREEQKHKRYVQTMPTISGASDAVNALIHKFKIVIVTARAPESDAWTKKWLTTNGIPYDAYVNTKEGSKHNTDIDHSILIDDYLGNIEQYLEQSDGKAILFSQPWNQDRTHLQSYMEENYATKYTNWDICVRRGSYSNRHTRRRVQVIWS